MIDNPKARIDKLATIDAEQLSRMYANVFSTGDGELVLEDLRAKFWKYVPPMGDTRGSVEFKVGQQSVLLHIENTINNQKQGEDNVKQQD